MVASQPTPDHISGRSMEGANPVIDDQSRELPNRTANVSSGATNGVDNGAESSQIAERKRKRSSEEIKQELLDKVRAKALLLPAPSPVSPTRSASTTPPRSSPPTSVESASPSSPASPQPVVVGEKMCIVGIPVYAREITMLRVFLASVYRGCRSTSEGGRMLWRLKAERKGEMEARLRELETGWIAIEDIPTEEE